MCNETMNSVLWPGLTYVKYIFLPHTTVSMSVSSGVWVVQVLGVDWVEFSSVLLSLVEISWLEFSWVKFSWVKFSWVEFNIVELSSIWLSSVEFSWVQFVSYHHCRIGPSSPGRSAQRRPLRFPWTSSPRSRIPLQSNSPIYPGATSMLPSCTPSWWPWHRHHATTQVNKKDAGRNI